VPRFRTSRFREGRSSAALLACCARAESGHVAVPPSRSRNWRRRIDPLGHMRWSFQPKLYHIGPGKPLTKARKDTRFRSGLGCRPGGPALTTRA
jgi:hypothetical protein